MDSSHGTRTDKTHAPAGRNRQTESWIESFMDYTDNLPSPHIFRLWSAIAAVGSAGERRVHTSLRGMRPLYPNTFILLTAFPGIGKSVVINQAEHFLRCTSVKIAPATMTKAALVDALKDSHQLIDGGPLGVMEYHSLQIPSPELGNLIPAYDLMFMNVINDLFDCRDNFTERTRGGGEISIGNPQISLLGGTQPDYLSAMIPEAAWGQGFTSRMIMVYSDDKTASKRSLFSFKKPSRETHEALAHDIQQIANLKGEFLWTPEAAKVLDQWHLAGGPPIPNIPRLEHYVTRRTIHLVKLMMISSMSRTNDLTITEYDFDTALSWLIEAETTMPLIFRAMIAAGDTALLADCAGWCREEEARLNRPVTEHSIINFLRTRMKSADVTRAFEVMKLSNLIRQAGFDEANKPTYTASIAIIAPPTPAKPPRQASFTFSVEAPSPPSRTTPHESIVPARYILRVTQPEDEEEIHDEDFATIHG